MRRSPWHAVLKMRPEKLHPHCMPHADLSYSSKSGVVKQRPTMSNDAKQLVNTYVQEGGDEEMPFCYLVGPGDDDDGPKPDA